MLPNVVGLGAGRTEPGVGGRDVTEPPTSPSTQQISPQDVFTSAASHCFGLTARARGLCLIFLVSATESDQKAITSHVWDVRNVLLLLSCRMDQLSMTESLSRVCGQGDRMCSFFAVGSSVMLEVSAAVLQGSCEGTGDG